MYQVFEFGIEGSQLLIQHTSHSRQDLSKNLQPCWLCPSIHPHFPTPMTVISINIDNSDIHLYFAAPIKIFSIF
jgi:hypothetical protein